MYPRVIAVFTLCKLNLQYAMEVDQSKKDDDVEVSTQKKVFPVTITTLFQISKDIITVIAIAIFVFCGMCIISICTFKTLYLQKRSHQKLKDLKRSTIIENPDHQTLSKNNISVEIKE